MEASQPGKWDSWVNEISLDSYLLLGYFFPVYMDKRASPVGAISLESGEISVGGMKIFPCKHISRAGPLTGMKNVEMRVRI